MGKTRDTGFLGNCVFTDASNNVGIGAAASGSFKLQVTGTTNLTGALSGTSATFSSTLSATNDLTINAALTPLIFLNTTSTGKASGIITQESGTSKWGFGSSFGSGDGTFNIYNYTAGARFLTITSGGNVGIGTSSPGEQLTLSKSTYPTVKLIETTDNASGYFQYHSDANEFRLLTITSHPLIFSTTDTERMRITSGGIVKIGTTADLVASNRKLEVLGACAISGKSTGTGGEPVLEAWQSATSGDNVFCTFITESSYTLRGSITYNRSANLTVYNTTSDYRLKTEINDFNALNIISNLKPKEFRIGNAEKKSIGFIAHELQEYYPQAVSGQKDAIDKDGNPIYQSVDYSQLTGLLVKAIQELEARIKQLENK